MPNLVVTDRQDLHRVNAEIHDWFYDIEDIAFDPARSELTIPFRRWSYEEARLVSEDPPPTGWRRLLGATATKHWEAPWYRWFLRIQNATSYHLQDDARIGDADFDEVTYDPGRSTVTIEGNLPVTIEVRVHTLAIEVEQTYELLGIARYRTTENSDSYTGQVFPLS